LIQRANDGTWALPGGIVEIGITPSDAVLKELWEEAGLRGRIVRPLGVFDGHKWGSLSPIHHIVLVYEVECNDLRPGPGVETLKTQFFAIDALPLDNMHPSHVSRVPKVIQIHTEGSFYADPADTHNVELPTIQRLDPTD
jgi:ADP-ribose pyrophosphatase YjhB (NUDIX family)